MKYIKYGTKCNHKDFIYTDDESGAIQCTDKCEHPLSVNDMEPRVYVVTFLGPKWIKESDYEDNVQDQIDKEMGN